MARAETVKNFLVKYGAAASQITTAGKGKQSPEVDNKTKEGRFINRRVTLTVTDAAGRLIKEGSIGEVIPALDPRLNAIQDMLKKQEECCSQILKRLDKLDDILAALKDLKGENDRLQTQINDLRNQRNPCPTSWPPCPSRSPSSRRRRSPTTRPWARWTNRRNAIRSFRCWA